MDGFDNQNQDPEVLGIQEAQQQREAQEQAETADLVVRLFEMLRVTFETVHAETASTRALEEELRQEQEAIIACDNRIASVQAAYVRANERLVEVNTQVEYWKGRLNMCMDDLNNQRQQNRAAQMRENTIKALIEEERQLIAELKSHGSSVTPNPK